MFHRLLNPFSYMLKAFLRVDRCITTVTLETGPLSWCVMGERKGKHCSPRLQLVKWTDNGNRLRKSIKLMGQTALSASWELVQWRKECALSESWWVMIHTLSLEEIWLAGALHVYWWWWVCGWAAADLFDELPPVVHKLPAPLPRTCRQPWPLYMSAGISLCAIPGGKLQLLVLSERDNK